MEFTDVYIIPLIIGLVKGLEMFNVPKKVLPVASLILGVAGGVFLVFPGDIKSGIVIGVFMGLSASGLYSATKTIAKTDDEK